MSYVFLALFAAASLVHLYHSWLNDRKKRAVTKPLLLLFLTLYYCTSAASVNVFLLLALVTSWLGDVLLIPTGHKWFTIGGISFLLSHVFFIGAYFRNIDFSQVRWVIVAPLAVLYVSISILIIRAVRDNTPKGMVLPMNLYLFCNSAMNIFALMQLMSYQSLGGWLAVLGAGLFFASDCSLFLVRYHAKPDVIFKKHFTVMLTYLLGEFLIVQGMLELLGKKL